MVIYYLELPTWQKQLHEAHSSQVLVHNN